MMLIALALLAVTLTGSQATRPVATRGPQVIANASFTPAKTFSMDTWNHQGGMTGTAQARFDLRAIPDAFEMAPAGESE